MRSILLGIMVAACVAVHATRARGAFQLTSVLKSGDVFEGIELSLDNVRTTTVAINSEGNVGIRLRDGRLATAGGMVDFQGDYDSSNYVGAGSDAAMSRYRSLEKSGFDGEFIYKWHGKRRANQLGDLATGSARLSRELNLRSGAIVIYADGTPEMLYRTGDVLDGLTVKTIKSNDINDNRDILYYLRTYDEKSHLAINDRVFVSDGDIVNGMTVAGVSPLQLNNSGDYLFFSFTGQSSLDEVDFSRPPTHGVFMNDELVVAAGQLINGRTVQWVQNASLNDNGEVGVAVIYDDRSFEVFSGVSSQLGVPEPSSWALVAAAGVLAVVWFRSLECR